MGTPEGAGIICQGTVDSTECSCEVKCHKERRTMASEVSSAEVTAGFDNNSLSDGGEGSLVRMH